MQDMTPVIAKCRRGNHRARLNIETDEGYVPVQFNRLAGDPYWDMVAVLDAIPYLVWCVPCRAPMLGRLIRARPGRETCSDRCTRSEGETCRCQCGGLNHGMDA